MPAAPKNSIQATRQKQESTAVWTPAPTGEVSVMLLLDAMNSSPEQPTEPTVARQDFSALFCERFRCRPAECEELAFRKCLHWRARLLAPVLRRILPRYFEQDFMLIRYFGQAV